MRTNPHLASRQQIQSIVRQHTASVELFLDDTQELAPMGADVVDWLEDLAAICHIPPEEAAYADYVQVSDLLDNLSDFFKLMNQETDGDFAATEVGQIWAQAKAWLVIAGRRINHFTRDQVWDWIAPATPDCLEDLGHNIFEAKWASPVPVMDIEILRRTEGVQFRGEPYEPRTLPKGIAVRFTICR